MDSGVIPGDKTSRADFLNAAFGVIEKMLKDADNPAATSAFIVEQVRELTGAGTVILLQCSHAAGSAGHRIVAVDPEERRGLAESQDADRLGELLHHVGKAGICRPGEASGEMQEIFSGLGCGASIDVPLRVGALQAGGLLLLDLPDSAGTSMVLEVLDALSTVVALIFRNSLLYEHLESMVEQRTRKLRLSEELFRTLAKAVPVGIFRLDCDCCCVYVNERWRRLSGLTEEEAIGTNWMKSVHPEDRNRVADEWFASFPLSPSFRSQFRLLRPDGSTIWTLCQAVQETDGERILGYTGVLSDITESREADDSFHALVESTVGITGEDFFDKIVLKTSEWLGCEFAVISELTDGGRLKTLSMFLDGSLIHNRSYSLAGTPCETVLQRGFSFYPDRLRERFPRHEELVKLGVESFVGVPLKDRDDRLMGALCVMSRRKMKLPSMAREVMSVIAARAAAEIERKKAEEEKAEIESRLRQAQKMEAIGTLAGGIAHDFNNILGAIIGYTDMALLDTTEQDPNRASLEEALKAAYRARDLVKKIIFFGRMKSGQELVPLDLKTVIAEALELLRASLPSTIEIRRNFACQSAAVMGDANQIQQILVNLFTNSAHAMQDHGGVLEVALEEAEIDSSMASRHPGAVPGPQVKLSVTDTGCGMDSATLERIFDPYFTTKETGKGTGLGLAVVYGIVKQHKGVITVRSSPGKGASFEVYLPMIPDREGSESAPDTPPPGGTERILFIDDEAPLVDLGRRMLERLGYRVTAGTDSVNALDLFLARPDDFDLVITDYTMPGMTGMEIAVEMLRVRPNIPIIL